ncbi:MAG: hypothetical protein ABJE95_30235 [Byssovorax sp.]
MVTNHPRVSPFPGAASARKTTRGLWLVVSACVVVGCSGDAGSAATSTGGDLPDGGPPVDAGPTCVDPVDAPPTDIFCTGLYENHDAQQHAKDAVPYTPGLTFWSDGAEKHRYLYLPPSTKIDTSSMDAWKFPVGTKAWKEFVVDGALVETRFLWKRDATNWVEAAYIWDAAVKSAVLTDRETPTLLANGYEIPSLKSCRKCHAGGADQLLGLEAIALALPTAEGVTLGGLAKSGSLSAPPSTTTIALPEDATGKAAAALGYLHVNCGMACHSTRGLSGFTQLHTRLRAEEFWPSMGGVVSTVATTDTYTTGLNQDVILATYAQAFPDTKLITPGSHDKSLAWRTAHLRGEHQMPPIVSHKIDDAGSQKLADWIDALPP